MKFPTDREPSMQERFEFYLLKEHNTTFVHRRLDDGTRRISVFRNYIGEGPTFLDAMHKCIEELENDGHRIRDYRG